MMTSGDLAKLLSELLSVPPATVDHYGRHLRGAGLLSVKGHGRGAAQMTARDAAVWLTALCIDHKRGGDFVREVKRVLSLPLQEAIVQPDHFADDLAIKLARKAGDALEFLIVDTLRPRIRDVLEKGTDCVTVSFDSDGFAMTPTIFGPYYPQIPGSVLYAFERGERKRRNVERTTSVHGRVLLEIAKGLGVPDPS